VLDTGGNPGSLFANIHDSRNRGENPALRVRCPKPTGVPDQLLDDFEIAWLVLAGKEDSLHVSPIREGKTGGRKALHWKNTRPVRVRSVGPEWGESGKRGPEVTEIAVGPLAERHSHRCTPSHGNWFTAEENLKEPEEQNR